MEQIMNKWKAWIENFGTSLWLKQVFGKGIKKMGGIEQVIKNSQILLNDNNESITLFYLIDNSYIDSLNESENQDVNTSGNQKMVNLSKKLKMKSSLSHTVAGYISYQKLFDQPLCSPEPNSGAITYVLKAISRDEKFAGWGIGKLISFLSVCLIANRGGYITSDRDTSDQAGKELVKSLKAIGADFSEPFDYIGWLKNEIGSHWDRTIRAEQGKGIKRLSPKSKHGYEERIAKLYNHLQPLTLTIKDDCAPSINILIGNERIANKNANQTRLVAGSFIKNLDDPSNQKFIDQLLDMSNDQIHNMLNKDENVQGYRFTISNKNLVGSVIKFINLINKSKEMTSTPESSQKFRRYASQGQRMFDRVYSKEVAKDKEKLYKNFFPDKENAPIKLKTRIKKRS